MYNVFLRMFFLLLAFTLIKPAAMITALPLPPLPRTIHVAKTGSDNNSGKLSSPLLTINKAASLARAGDSVIVHRGIYRESIFINVGGASDDHRVIFIAAPGETVTIKGSERTGRWTRLRNHTWRLTITDSFFTTFNPFKILVDSSINLGHLGAVYLNTQPLREMPTLDAIYKNANSWFVQDTSGNTLITANFGTANPNISPTEINVRPIAFFGNKVASYITLDGFNIEQVASPMAFMNGVQPGAIATNGATHWIIQHCTLNDCKSVAISIGQTGNGYPEAGPSKPEYSDLSQDINSVGHHVINNNHIFRCGQAGIFGLLHGTASEISDNRIEDINSEATFPGFESAGIRLAVAVDVIISHNLVRRVHASSPAGGYGIFIGPLFQGARISRNIITETLRSPLYFLNSHGPALIDNNIFSGPGKNTNEGIKMVSTEANVFVQNLFNNCDFTNIKYPGRSIATSNFLPHSLVIKQTIPALPIDHRWFSNLFIRGGLDNLPATANCEVDYNLYLDSAVPTRWADQNSITLNKKIGFKLIDENDKLNIVINSELISKIACPMLSPSYIGFFALSKQFIEDPNGHAITVNKDFDGIGFNGLLKFPGPFYQLPENGHPHLLFNYQKK